MPGGAPAGNQLQIVDGLLRPDFERVIARAAVVRIILRFTYELDSAVQHSLSESVFAIFSEESRIGKKLRARLA